MMIYVQYYGGKYDYIKPAMLDDKLVSGEIRKFLRSNGWAIVGQDPIRQPDSAVRRYSGKERRQNFH